MGVIIDTDDKVTNLFGVGLHGFKNGDSQTGIAPTGLEAGWFNNTQQEINNVLAAAGVTPSNASNAQLAAAILTLISDQKNSGFQLFRQSPGADPDLSHRWQWRRRAAGIWQAPSGTVQTLCAMTEGMLSSQCTYKFHINVVGTDTLTNYGNAIIAGSLRIGGASVIQATANLLYDVPLAGLILASVIDGFGLLSARVVIPAAPAAKLYNIHAYCEIVNVAQ